MIRMIIIALALATGLTGTGIGEEIEIEVDEDGCYQVPPKCISMESRWAPARYTDTKFFINIIFGACEGRVLIKNCVEGPDLILPTQTVRRLFSDDPVLPTIRGRDYVCITTWRELPEVDRFMSSSKPGQWIVEVIAATGRYPLQGPLPTGRAYGAWIGSIEPENDRVCINRHEGWNSPPDFSR